MSHFLVPLPIILSATLTATPPKTTVVIAQTPPRSTAPATCRPTALSQFRRHRLQPSDTLAGLAQAYNLRPDTLQGANPSLRGGAVPVGRDIFIPPFDGVLIQPSPGTSLTSLGKTYGVRPDILFEINGCQTQPRQVFIPGVRWTPQGIVRYQFPAPVTPAVSFQAPLAIAAAVLVGYGWQVDQQTGKGEFHPGIDLAAPARARVVAVAAGTVAFAGDRPGSGGLVVINHAAGLQTRYAQLDQITVSVGEQVGVGQLIGTVAGAQAGQPSHLHFEVRLNSANGWVAHDPTRYLPISALVNSDLAPSIF